MAWNIGRGEGNGRQRGVAVALFYKYHIYHVARCPCDEMATKSETEQEANKPVSQHFLRI